MTTEDKDLVITRYLRDKYPFIDISQVEDDSLTVQEADFLDSRQPYTQSGFPNKNQFIRLKFYAPGVSLSLIQWCFLTQAEDPFIREDFDSRRF